MDDKVEDLLCTAFRLVNPRQPPRLQSLSLHHHAVVLSEIHRYLVLYRWSRSYDSIRI